MKPKVFIDAARLLYSDKSKQHFACYAIAKVKESRGAEMVEFAGLFRPDRYFDNGSGWYGWPRFEENRQARSLALLLCAEIVKEEL